MPCRVRFASLPKALCKRHSAFGPIRLLNIIAEPFLTCSCGIQDATGVFAATIPEGPLDTMYTALKRAISKHSPAILPKPMIPLVIAGPFGAACQKSHLLQWLLKVNTFHVPEKCPVMSSVVHSAFSKMYSRMWWRGLHRGHS